jgi:RNA polymerase sigma-70 factor (ECF subfamily)
MPELPDFVAQTLPGAAPESFRTYLLCIAEQHLDPDLRAKAGASDLVQQTLLAAHSARHAFRGTTAEELRGWLRAILMNTMRNFRRQWRQTQGCRVNCEASLDLAWGVPADDDSPSRRASQDEQKQRLAAAISLLPVRQQQVIALRFQDGCSFVEVGQMLGCSEDAARMLLNRAIDSLRDILHSTGI